MPRPPIPIGQINRRIPEAGRIRTGEVVATRSGKSRPTAISDFIFTSAERNNVEAIAGHLGGEVRPYESQGNKSPDRWMVRPGISEIAVALPPDPLGGTPIYEQYGGGGATHRCDGVVCTKYRKGSDGAPEPYEVECECAAAGVLACNVTTHLSVLLQGVRMTGVWRLTTKSYNAAVELPGMVEMVQSLQDRGIVRAVLGLKPHRQVLAGVTREFLVPVLGVDATLEELAAGQASVAALPAAPAAAETPVAIGSGGGEAGKGFAAEVASEAPPSPSGAFEGSLGDALPAAERPALASGGGEPVGSVRPQSAPAAPSGAPDDEVVDAEIVEPGGEHVDNREVRVAPGVGTTPGSTDLHDLIDLIDKTKGLGPSKVLRRARELAEEMSLPLPSAFDDLEPGPLLDALHADLDPDDDGGPPSGGGNGPAPQVCEDCGHQAETPAALRVHARRCPERGAP